MKRRAYLTAVSSAIGLSSGCLSTFAQKRDIPVEISNKSNRQFQLTISVLNDSSGEQVFSESVEVDSGKATEITIKELREDIGYTLTATTEDGAKKHSLIKKDTAQFDIRITEDGEWTILHAKYA